MEQKIMIANWLLTRKCNLQCGYCAIVCDYKTKPIEYPDMAYYHKNEMSTEYVIKSLDLMKKHNSNMFHIWYGGEPTLRKDLPDIIDYCNKNDIYYTIITNNSPEVQPMLKRLLDSVEYVTGLTSSIDPIYDEDDSDDKVKKSLAAFEMFKEYKSVIKDLVAEITVTNDNVKHLHRLVKSLTEIGVSSSITFVDIAKNNYYDFSNVKDESLLVQKSPELKRQFDMIFIDNLDVHMGKELCDEVMDILPAQYTCDLQRNLHNITIDADGTLRTCLRIRGTKCPRMTTKSLFSRGGIKKFKQAIKDDKLSYCSRCNWTCPMMSSIASRASDKVNDLLHTDRRK